MNVPFPLAIKHFNGQFQDCRRCSAESHHEEGREREMSHAMYIVIYLIYSYTHILIYSYTHILIYSSKEVGKQYFRVTNDFYLMELTLMKGGRSHNNT